MKTDQLQVVMPMAGRGQRFRDAGFDLPKPLILVDGKPMFLRALDSIAGIGCDLFLIVRGDAEDEFQLTREIKKHYPLAGVHVLRSDTGGAAESVLSLEHKLNMKVPLLILDCDLFFESNGFLSLIKQGDRILEDGLLLTFNSDDPRYSYVRCREGVALEVREKVVISNQALIGAYYWKSTGDFIKYTKDCIVTGINESQREFYISNTFQKGIESGLSFRVVEGKFQSFGTPEELNYYNLNSRVSQK
jgi:dTDP-glucose pyrophosphorylase